MGGTGGRMSYEMTARQIWLSGRPSQWCQLLRSTDNRASISFLRWHGSAFSTIHELSYL